MGCPSSAVEKQTQFTKSPRAFGAGHWPDIALQSEPVFEMSGQDFRHAPASLITLAFSVAEVRASFRAQSAASYRTCSTRRLPAGSGRSSSGSGRDCSSQARQFDRSSTTICRSWMGAASGPGLGRQQREAVTRAVGHGTPQTGEAEPVLPGLGELPFRFRRFRAGEFEEVRRGHQAAPLREPPPLRAEIDDRRAFRPARRKPQRNCTNSNPSSTGRITGAVSVGQMSSRGSRFGAALGNRPGSAFR